MHMCYEDLEKKIEDAKQKIEIGAYYFHYKTPFKKYKVLYIGFLEENEAPCVIYQAALEDSLKEGLIWVRDLESFLGFVTLDNHKIRRFVKF